MPHRHYSSWPNATDMANNRALWKPCDKWNERLMGINQMSFKDVLINMVLSLRFHWNSWVSRQDGRIKAYSKRHDQFSRVSRWVWPLASQENASHEIMASVGRLTFVNISTTWRLFQIFLSSCIRLRSVTPWLLEIRSSADPSYPWSVLDFESQQGKIILVWNLVF